MSVLNTIKGKIVNVQQDISESFRSLTKSNSRSKSVDAEVPAAKNDAANELLSRYQKSWVQTHRTSEDLAQRTQHVDSLVTNLFQYMDQQYTALNQFATEMSGLTQIVSDVSVLKDKIVSLEGASGELESLLVELEDICDQRNLLKLKQDHENELKKYQHSKNMELEQVKVALAKTHAAKVQKFEDQLSVTLRERQKVFEEAHREQMIKYMTTGEVELPQSPLHSSDLADVEIEQDQNELDQFLGSIDEREPLDEKTPEENSETEDEFDVKKICVLLDEDCNASNNNDLESFKSPNDAAALVTDSDTAFADSDAMFEHSIVIS